MWPIGLPPRWVGREQELAILRASIEALARGEGAVVWVEGEPGIGKSCLVAEALAGADQPGLDVGWGMADTLTERLPLAVMQDCLQVRLSSPDPRRAHVADLFRELPQGLLADGDSSVAGIEMLATLVDELCAAAPTVIVIDDLQWADDASLLLWHQLAASIHQLRLLLIGTCRTPLRRPQAQQVRAAVLRRGGAVITLGPLSETDVAQLVTTIVGVPPGDTLRRLAAEADGNPLYVRELVDALVRERALHVGLAAEVSMAQERLPVTLTAVLNDRLSSVPAETAQMLRTAALLGGTFAVSDLAVLMRRRVSELSDGLQESVAAGILVGSGPDLAFRHLLIQQALYESMPPALRAALHAEGAQELAANGDVLRVAQQLLAANQPSKGWVRTWLSRAAPELITRAPQIAVELLRRELDEMPLRGEALDGLMVDFVQALIATGSYQEAATEAARALTVITDPVRRAETYWMLERSQISGSGDYEAATTTVRRALASADLPGAWRARFLAALAMLQRVITGDLELMDATARQAITAAEEAGDAFAAVGALVELWLSHSVRRDHAAALDYIEQALRVLADDPRPTDRRFYGLDRQRTAMHNRIFTLQNLDRWPEAALALRQARELALRTGSTDTATGASAAVLQYWLGQWDDALAELGSYDPDSYPYLRDLWPALIVHGVAALIAGRREQRTTAGEHLRRGLALAIENRSTRENRDFLVAAHAVALEQNGETGQALLSLAAILPRREGEMTLVHQWLPDLVRLALSAGDRRMAEAAAQACRAEAEAETRPARASAASLRCQGLLESDPDRLRDVVAHYRKVGPAVELPAALEDLAVVLAQHSHEEDARSALNEAVGLYEDLQARWDIRRADGRLRLHGIKRGVRGRRAPRASSGWEALTATEVNVAALVARGDSTSDIARGLFLSRKTVQTYISHILTKLGANSRVEIVREALRQGVSP
jgi:DNA-binding CsgD family transcriptional regulator/tetratricopeptide (TPR) repeat protein